MPDEDRLHEDGLLGLIELLAVETTPRHQGEPPEPATRTTPEEPALRERARRLAQDAHALAADRRQREAGLDALAETARELTLPYDLETFLGVAVRRARHLLGCDVGWINLVEPVTGHARTHAVDGLDNPLSEGFRLPASGGAVTAAAATSRPFWTPDYLTDERFPHVPVVDGMVREERLHAVLVVPLKSGDTMTGALYVADRAVRHFGAAEIALLTSLGDLVTVAVEKARLLGHAPRDATAPAATAPDARAPDHDRRVNQLRTGLIDTVLRGSGLDELVAGAVTDLGGPLMVRDSVGRTLTRTDGFPDADEAELFQRTLDAHAERAPVRTADGLWLCPAHAGQVILGTIVLAPGDRPGPEPEPLLQALAQAVSVLLRMRAGATAAEGSSRDELLTELIAPSPRSIDQLAVRARRFGVDLEEPHVVLVLRPEGGPQGRALVWSSSYAHRHAGLKTTDEERLVLVLPGSDASHAARAAAAALSAAIGHPVTAGSAGPVSHPRGVRRSYAEARRCLDALTALGGTGTTATPRDLGFLGLLLADSPDTAAFIAGTMGPVLEYDARHDTELARTLEAYFAAGGSPRRAAESLHVHPNTVSRRLERITELLGPGWQEPVQALEVQLALRLRRTRHALRGQAVPLVGTWTRHRP
ncbi:helix-turn-helix domain-containing protein [Streptomyces sp. NPDC088387]|uniref:helix-turn-helix domain-containing protein n=1 Tax=Streptomyces sp. NPDC088387 TaxID=3365859 RepID=UPI00381952EB